jgi:hypothetical protein
MDDNLRDRSSRLSLGGWVAIVVLGALLAWTLWYATHAWNALSGVGITGFGWMMLVLGVLVTLGVGGGMMALLFYSSRKHYDQ